MSAKELTYYFNVREVGSSLQEVAVDVVHNDGNSVLTKWYHSDYDVDLFLWYDKRHNLIKQQLFTCGQVVEWNLVDGVRTGYIVEIEEKDSEDLIYDNQLLDSSVQQAVQMVHYMECIDEELKADLIDNFKNSPQIDNMNPGDVVSRYGEKKQKSLLKRLINWLQVVILKK